MQVENNLVLSPQERRLMLEVLDGFEPHELVTNPLFFLDAHCPRKYLLPILNYLKKNKLVGNRLVELVGQHFKWDYAAWQLWCIQQISYDKDRNIRLIAGDNFKC